MLQRHVPTKKFIDEKLGFGAAGMGVLSTCAPAEMGMASAVSDSQREKRKLRIVNLLTLACGYDEGKAFPGIIDWTEFSHAGTRPTGKAI